MVTWRIVAAIGLVAHTRSVPGSERWRGRAGRITLRSTATFSRSSKRTTFLVWPSPWSMARHWHTRRALDVTRRANW